MLRRILAGLGAGAIGTVALNVTTYLDMVLRGRSASDVPARTAGKLADMAGVDLGNSAGAAAGENPDQRRARAAAESRRTGVGALLGYATGLGVGALFGLLSPIVGRAPLPATGLLLGAAAMAGSDVPTTSLGVTDPRRWGAPGWMADIVPHLAYGLFTALAFRTLTRRRPWWERI